MTKLYQQITVSTGAAVGQPAPLPSQFVGLSDASLADLSCIDPAPDGYADAGFTPYAPPPAAPTEDYIAKEAFYSLFTADEIVAFNAVRKAIAALQQADYQAVAAGTATAQQQGLVEFEAFLTILDAADQVNLLDPRLPSGLGLCVGLGVLAGQDRVTAILAGQNPA